MGMNSFHPATTLEHRGETASKCKFHNLISTL